MSADPLSGILNQAWALLWRPDSPWHLPTTLARGGNFGRTVMHPMAAITIPDTGPVPLYSSDTRGNVSIALSSMTLDGLASIADHGLTWPGGTGAIQATVALGDLTFSGSYQADAAGPAMTTLEIATSLGRSRGAAGEEPPAANIALARDYRDQLLRPGRSGNGAVLVGKYYDHNDTVNRIFSDKNGFTSAWPGSAPGNPPAQNTAYYMDMTADAASHPGDPDYTVGGDDYLMHGVYMQTLLIKACQDYEQQDPDHAADYRALADDAARFQGNVNGFTNDNPGPVTVDVVMSAVTNTHQMPDAELAAIPEPEAVRRGREAAEQDFPALQRRALAERAAREQQVTRAQTTGRFSAEIAMPAVTLSGTVAVTGAPPFYQVSVEFTALSAPLPSPRIALAAGTDADFTAEVQARLDRAQWFQRVLGTRLRADAGSPQTLRYLSGLFNQAISAVLAG